MSRLIKGVVIGIPVLIITGIIVFYFSFNSIVKNGIEAIGPKVLGADVVLEEVNMSIFSGKGQLKGIMVGNPEGFHAESAFKLGEVRVAVDVASIFSDKIVINEIFIDAPEITYETSGGKNNIEALIENVNDYIGVSEGGAADSKKEVSQEGQKKVQIDNLTISNARVNFSATILKGKKLSLSIPDIHLKDIGKDDEGASMSDVLKEVLAELNKSIVAAVAEPLKSAGETVGKAMGKAGEAVGEAVDKLKGFFK